MVWVFRSEDFPQCFIYSDDAQNILEEKKLPRIDRTIVLIALTVPLAGEKTLNILYYRTLAT